MLTIVLAIGVRRMATRNEMMVRGLVTGDAIFGVTGSGHAPVGDFLLGSGEVEPAESPALLELARAALLCNDADLREGPDRSVVDGDPMEGALVSRASRPASTPTTPSASCRAPTRSRSAPRIVSRRLSTTATRTGPSSW